jgi:hypothetical protein
MVLLVPPKPDGSTLPPDAQLTTVRNRVEVLNPETKPGKPNDPLFRGNRVSTLEASAADVTFRDETQVALGERTLVIILGDARAAAAKAVAGSGDTQTTLVTGNLRAWMGGARKDGAALAVGTDAAHVRIPRGEAQVSSDAVRTTRLAVYDGASTIAARGTTRAVARGFGSKAELGHEPTPPRPLPAAPAWTTLPATLVVDAPIVGEYGVATATSPRATSWHVQIARDDGFHEVVADTKAPTEVHRLEARAPGAGRYFVRVSAIDDDQFEGPFGDVARVLVMHVTVARLGARRRIDVEPADAACFRVGNVPLTRLRGPLDVAANEPVRLRCAAAETEPTTPLSFD